MRNWTDDELALKLRENLDLRIDDGMMPCQQRGIEGGRAMLQALDKVLTEHPELNRITEAAHQVNVINLLHDNGWKVCEFRKARIKKAGQDVYRTPFGADGPGFPDLFAVRPPRAMLIEDKSDTGAASPNQVNWLLLCGRCPQLEVRVVRPEDMAEFAEIVK